MLTQKTGKVDTTRPADPRLRQEMDEYAPGVWIFWDPKFRASHQVSVDWLVRFKK